MPKEQTADKVVEVRMRDQLGKVLAATTAAFIATKLVENAYDKFVVARRYNKES
jgi:hypothetical protein